MLLDSSVWPFWLGGMSWRCCRKGSRWSKWSLSPCGAQCLSSDSGALGPISTLTVVAREAPPPWRWVLCWGSRQVYWILLVGSHHWRDAAPQLLKVAWQACRTKTSGAGFFLESLWGMGKLLSEFDIKMMFFFFFKVYLWSRGHSSQTTLDKDRTEWQP